MKSIENNIQGFGNDDYCILLLHGRETISTLTFTDSSFGGNEHTCTIASADLVLQDETVKRFGEKSFKLLYNSNDASIVCGNDTDDYENWQFGKNNYTIDTHLRIDQEFVEKIDEFYLFNVEEDSDNYHRIYFQPVNYDNYFLFDDEEIIKFDDDDYVLYTNSTQPFTYNFVYEVKSSGNLDINITFEFNIAGYAGNWIHLVIVRIGSAIRIYIDDELMGTDTVLSGYTMPEFQAPFNVHSANNATDHITYIQEFRISKGLARWTRSFNIPSREY